MDPPRAWTRGLRAATVLRLRTAGCVFAEDEARLLLGAAAGEAELLEMVERRAAGLPLEQVLGWADPWGIRIQVDPGVFVPRPRTALLVREAVALARPGAVMVDLCCGSGAIGLAVALRVPGVEVHAADVDPAAVACATRNLAPVGGRVHQGNLFEALPQDLRGGVSILAANAPYVPTAELALLPREARLHEPARALDGGLDGLDLHRRIGAGAPAWLRPGGHLLVEVAGHQSGEAVRILECHGLSARIAHDPELEATVIIGAAPAA